MKKLILISIVLFQTATMNSIAQDKPEAEKFGNTLNLGAGIGYYGYIGHSLPVGMLNYEFDVARNFTLAPFAGIYTYQNYYYWGNPNQPNGDESYRLYSYRATAVPVGVKGTYYFDQLFRANPKWDFYASGSTGFIFRSVTWENGYYGDKHVYQNASPLYLDAHVGAEYHMTEKAGIFLDLSSGVSTFGLAIHF
ncbi:MAG: hypothetical protein A3K10_06500 [Bacteroidetes bacterium RIFCSPLOWO2_12_FULL_31_6]|nr:MAG: hypothetical protein A3K10_06500 [Bacteroidetes bacterium RIFCSPLOWO2_12_FULL_31_6]